MGEPLVFRAAMRPISTLSRAFPTEDLTDEQPAMPAKMAGTRAGAASMTRSVAEFVLVTAIVAPWTGHALPESLIRYFAGTLRFSKVAAQERARS